MSLRERPDVLSGQASVCEGCLKPRQHHPALGRSMGDQGCEQMCLGVTEPIPGAIAQASTPDLGHKKAPCDARGRVMGTTIVHALVNTRCGVCSPMCARPMRRTFRPAWVRSKHRDALSVEMDASVVPRPHQSSGLRPASVCESEQCQGLLIVLVVVCL